MNNARDVHEKKIDNAPTIALSLLNQGKQTKKYEELISSNVNDSRSRVDAEVRAQAARRCGR